MTQTQPTTPPPTPFLAGLHSASTMLGALSVVLRADTFHKAAAELPEALQKQAMIDGEFRLTFPTGGEIQVHRESTIPR